MNTGIFILEKNRREYGLINKTTTLSLIPITSLLLVGTAMLLLLPFVNRKVLSTQCYLASAPSSFLAA